MFYIVRKERNQMKKWIAMLLVFAMVLPMAACGKKISAPAATEPSVTVEPVTEPVTEPTTEPTTEPATEATIEPATEATTQPVEESSTETTVPGETQTEVTQ